MGRVVVFGIPANWPQDLSGFSDDDGIIRDRTMKENEDIWCDFELDYFEDEAYYQFFFETFIGFKSEDDCRKWLIYCFDKLTEYMISQGYNTSKKINLYQAFTDGVNVNTKFEDIGTAYAWMKMMIYGFHGNGL